jgi:hypothetical protein
MQFTASQSDYLLRLHYFLIDKNELAPGESMEVEAIFRSGSKTGYQMNNIDVISNDPDQPKLTLQIKGNLISVPKR